MVESALRLETLPKLHCCLCHDQFPVTVDFLTVWIKAGAEPTLFYPPRGRTRTLQKPFQEVERYLSLLVSPYGLNVDSYVTGMVFEGEREGQRSQGQAAKWTSLCIRLLFRLHAVCGVQQTSFWKRPSALFRSVKVHFRQTVCSTDSFKIPLSFRLHFYCP